MAAWAPKRYQRMPALPRPSASAARASAITGTGDTAKLFAHADVDRQIGFPLGGAGPASLVEVAPLPQVARHAQRVGRTHTLLALSPMTGLECRQRATLAGRILPHGVGIHGCSL